MHYDRRRPNNSQRTTAHHHHPQEKKRLTHRLCHCSHLIRILNEAIIADTITRSNQQSAISNQQSAISSSAHHQQP
jgi:hypothetical protein